MPHAKAFGNYKISGDVNERVCASCDKTVTQMDNLIRHMKQQNCDDVYSIVTKVHFEHPVILCSTVIQHITAIYLTHTTL